MVAGSNLLVVDDATPKGRGHLPADASTENGYTGVGGDARLVVNRAQVTARGGAGAAGIGGG